MKLAAVLVPMFLMTASMAKADCEAEAQSVINRYLAKRDVAVDKYLHLNVQALTPGSYWQQYDVTATVVTEDGERMRLRFTMTSPFICDDLSIESVR